MEPLLIAAGGALGTLMRYGLNVSLAGAFGGLLPLHTFVANVVGSFALGLLMELGAGRHLAGTELRLVLGTGVLGGFTTYSSFNLESLTMAQEGQLGRAAGYVLGTLVVCLLAGAAGIALGRLAKA